MVLVVYEPSGRMEAMSKSLSAVVSSLGGLIGAIIGYYFGEKAVVRTPSNPACALQIWTWGLFNVLVEIEDKSGNRHKLEHWTSYSRDIKQEARYEQVQAS